MDQKFREVQDEYFRLRGLFSTGRLTQSEFEAALDKLMFDYQGRYWMIGVNTGKWYVHDGTRWNEAEPPAEPPNEPSVSAAARPEMGTPATREYKPAVVAPPPSPDGSLLAAGEVRRFVGHMGAVQSVAFSPDGRRLVSGGADGAVRVWETGTGRLLQVMKGHTLEITAVDLTGRKLAVSGSGDSTVRVWDTDHGKPIRELHHRDAVTCVAFSPDGRYSFSGGEDKMLCRWNFDRNKIETRYEGHTAAVTSLAVSRNGGLLISLGNDATLRIWDVPRGRELKRIDLGASYDDPFSQKVTISPDGKYALTCSLVARADLWDLNRGVHVREFAGPMVNAFGVAFTPDGRRVLASSGSDYLKPEERPGGNDNFIWIWDLASGALQARLEGHLGNVNSIAVSPDGKWIASASRDTSVRLWQPNL